MITRFNTEPTLEPLNKFQYKSRKVHATNGFNHS